MSDLGAYYDGILPPQWTPPPTHPQLCPTCHEVRPDLSLPCEHCGEVE